MAQSMNFNGRQGYLATITSETENSHIRQLVKNHGWRSDAWLGGSDAQQEGIWRWATGPEAGTEMNYSNWVAGEPNNLGEEDYLVLAWDQGRWNDLSGVATGRIGVKSLVVEYGSPSNCSPALTAMVTLDLTAASNSTLTTRKAEGSLEVGLTATQLMTYPNPFTQSTTVALSLQQDTDYSLEVYDLKGQLVQRLQSGKGKVGAFIQASWEPKQAATGVYIIRLVTQTGVQHRRVVKE